MYGPFTDRWGPRHRATFSPLPASRVGWRADSPRAVRISRRGIAGDAAAAAAFPAPLAALALAAGPPSDAAEASLGGVDPPAPSPSPTPWPEQFHAVGFIWYYEDVLTHRPVRWNFYTGMQQHVMSFEVGGVLEDSKWQAPGRCFNDQEAATNSNIATKIVSEVDVMTSLLRIQEEKRVEQATDGDILVKDL
uniref:Uncharacterized protein n=1 Tax=Oryza brachyantha TaxID=4533 RepID=J3MJ50_ORYBR